LIPLERLASRVDQDFMIGAVDDDHAAFAPPIALSRRFAGELKIRIS